MRVLSRNGVHVTRSSPTGPEPSVVIEETALVSQKLPTGRRPVLAWKKQRSILYAGSDGARGGRRVVGVTPCWARTRFRSLVPGLVTLTLVRSRTGIVRSRSSRSEEYLSFTPRRAIHPSRRRTAGRHQTAIQFLERSFLICLCLRSFPPGGARRGHVRNCCFSEEYTPATVTWRIFRHVGGGVQEDLRAERRASVTGTRGVRDKLCRGTRLLVRIRCAFVTL